jgi:hypothetical protein
MKVIPETHTKFDIYGFFLDKTILSEFLEYIITYFIEIAPNLHV